MPTLTSFQRMPSWRSTLRATSAMRTCRFTWVGAATFMRLTTRAGSSTNWFATCTHVRRLLGVRDRAGQHQRLVDGAAVTDWPGAMRRMPCCSASMLWVTRIAARHQHVVVARPPRTAWSRRRRRRSGTSAAATSPRRRPPPGWRRRGSRTPLDPDQLAGADHEARPTRSASRLRPARRRRAGPARRPEGRRGPRQGRRRGGDVGSLLSFPSGGGLFGGVGGARPRAAQRAVGRGADRARRARSAPWWSRSRRTRASCRRGGARLGGLERPRRTVRARLDRVGLGGPVALPSSPPSRTEFSTSDRVPSVWASVIISACCGETSSVAVLATGGASASPSLSSGGVWARAAGRRPARGCW